MNMLRSWSYSKVMDYDTGTAAGAAAVFVVVQQLCVRQGI